MIREISKEESLEIDDRFYHETTEKFEDKDIALGIEEDGKLVAGIFGGMIAPHIFYIPTLFVDEQHRGKGYGKKLIQALEEKARSLGIAVIQLSTENGHAEHFYPKLGYEQVGFYEHPIRNIREVFYTKKLKGGKIHET